MGKKFLRAVSFNMLWGTGYKGLRGGYWVRKKYMLGVGGSDDLVYRPHTISTGTALNPPMLTVIFLASGGSRISLPPQ